MIFFSIIIPCYNSAKYLPVAVSSIFTQTFKNYEIIIVDDGSIDHTADMVKSFSSPAINYLYQKNCGVSGARNAGANIAKGKWLIFLDADDELSQDALFNFFQIIQINAKLDVVVAGFLRKKYSSHKGYIELPIPNQYHSKLSGSYSINTEVFLNTGGFDTDLKFSENMELFHRLRNHKIKLASFSSLIYNEFLGQGSKNLINASEGILHILSKHKDTLSMHQKRVYFQILGINNLRFKNYKKARLYLLKALKINPTKITTLARFFIACCHPLARKLYPLVPRK